MLVAKVASCMCCSLGSLEHSMRCTSWHMAYELKGTDQSKCVTMLCLKLRGVRSQVGSRKWADRKSADAAET